MNEIQMEPGERWRWEAPGGAGWWLNAMGETRKTRRSRVGFQEAGSMLLVLTSPSTAPHRPVPGCGYPVRMHLAIDIAWHFSPLSIDWRRWLFFFFFFVVTSSSSSSSFLFQLCFPPPPRCPRPMAVLNPLESSRCCCCLIEST